MLFGDNKHKLLKFSKNLFKFYTLNNFFHYFLVLKTTVSYVNKINVVINNLT